MLQQRDFRELLCLARTPRPRICTCFWMQHRGHECGPPDLEKQRKSYSVSGRVRESKASQTQKSGELTWGLAPGQIISFQVSVHTDGTASMCTCLHAVIHAWIWSTMCNTRHILIPLRFAVISTFPSPPKDTSFFNLSLFRSPSLKSTLVFFRFRVTRHQDEFFHVTLQKSERERKP